MGKICVMFNLLSTLKGNNSCKMHNYQSRKCANGLSTSGFCNWLQLMVQFRCPLRSLVVDENECLDYNQCV